MSPSRLIPTSPSCLMFILFVSRQQNTLTIYLFTGPLPGAFRFMFWVWSILAVFFHGKRLFSSPFGGRYLLRRFQQRFGFSVCMLSFGGLERKESAGFGNPFYFLFRAGLNVIAPFLLILLRPFNVIFSRFSFLMRTIMNLIINKLCFYRSKK